MVKAKDRLTELNHIPDDWEHVSLNDICVSITDGTHYTPKYVKNGIPFYSVENVSMNDFENTKFITSEEHNKLIQRCKPEKGDILLTRIGTLGVTKLIDWEVDASIYVSLALLKIRKSINAKYIYNYTKSKSFVNDVVKNSLINAVPQKINMNEIGNIQIPMPKSKKEQEQIATVLSDMDDLIESLEKIIEKKKKIKQGTMQQLLTGEKRLPGYTETWKENKLGNLAFIKTGTRNNQDQTVDGQYPFFVRSQDVVRINSYSYDCEAVIVPGEGGIGEIFHYIKGKFDAHQRVYVINEFNELSGKYIYYYLMQNFLDHALKYTVKATVDSLRLPTFQDFIIKFPPNNNEQKEIVKILSDMDAEIEALEEKLEKYKKLKEGMMQELLTGRIRLV